GSCPGRHQRSGCVVFLPAPTSPHLDLRAPAPCGDAPFIFFASESSPKNILKITRFCGNTIRSYDLTGARNKSTVAALTQQRPFNQRYVTSIVRWHRIAVVLSPSVGSVNIIFALFWIDIRSVFDGLQKRQPIFFWHVSRR